MGLIDYTNRSLLFGKPGTQASDSPWNKVGFTGSVVDAPQGPTAPADSPFTLPNYPTPSLDNYRHQVENMPDFDQYKLGKVGKALAVIAGASTMDPRAAYATSKGIMDEPRQEAIEKYKMKTGQLGELAGLEEKTNANNYKVALDTEKEKRERLLAQNTIQTGDSTRKLNEARIGDYQNQMANRGWTTQTDKTTGNLMAINRDGRKVNMGKIDWSNQEDIDNKFKDFIKRQGVETGEFKNRRMFSVQNPIPTVMTGVSPSEQLSSRRLATVEAKALLDAGGKVKVGGQDLDLSDPNGNRWSRFFDTGGNLVKPSAGWAWTGGPSQDTINKDWDIIQSIIEDKSKQAQATYKPPRVSNPLGAPDAGNPKPNAQVPKEVADFLATQDKGTHYDLGPNGIWDVDDDGNITPGK